MSPPLRSYAVGWIGRRKTDDGKNPNRLAADRADPWRAAVLMSSPRAVNRFCGIVSVWACLTPPPGEPTWLDLAPLLRGAFSVAGALCNQLWYCIGGFAVVAIGNPSGSNLAPLRRGFFMRGSSAACNQPCGSALSWRVCRLSARRDGKPALSAWRPANSSPAPLAGLFVACACNQPPAAPLSWRACWSTFAE